MTWNVAELTLGARRWFCFSHHLTRGAPLLLLMYMRFVEYVLFVLITRFCMCVNILFHHCLTKLYGVGSNYSNERIETTQQVMAGKQSNGTAHMCDSNL